MSYFFRYDKKQTLMELERLLPQAFTNAQLRVVAAIVMQLRIFRNNLSAITELDCRVVSLENKIKAQKLQIESLQKSGLFGEHKSRIYRRNKIDFDLLNKPHEDKFEEWINSI